MKTNSLIYSLLLLTALFFLTSSMNTVYASELYFIDAHSQLDHTVDNPELVIRRESKAE